MFRKATKDDIPGVAALYVRIHDAEQAGAAVVGWQRGVYPTRQTAEEGLRQGDLYVELCGGRLVAAARINRQQVPEYQACPWQYPAPAQSVLVLHTLVVDPAQKGRGYGAAFVAFYERCARAWGCGFLRMDTQAKNTAARAFYKKLGFSEPGVVCCTFNGIPDVQLVCLEKRLDLAGTD